MTETNTQDARDFDVSVGDFRKRASLAGWPFWRGVIVGFMAAFPLAYVALVGESLFGLRF